MGLDHKISVMTGDGETVLREKLQGEDPFDLIFIDAAKSHYKRFLEMCIRDSHLYGAGAGISFSTRNG